MKSIKISSIFMYNMIDDLKESNDFMILEQIDKDLITLAEQSDLELKDIYKATHVHRYHNKKTNDQV